MKKIMLQVKDFVEDENGVTAIEYALLASLIAIAIVSSVEMLGQSIKNVFISIANTLSK